MTKLTKSLALGAAVALAACGGSSSSSAPKITYTGKTTLATVTGANAYSLAGSATGVAGATSTVGPLAAVQTTPRATYQKAIAIAEQAIRNLPVTVTAAQQSQTQACSVSGSVTMAVSIADPTGNVVSSGDWIAMSFAACNDGTGDVVSGSMRIDILSTQNGIMPSPSDPTGMVPGATYGMKLTISDFIITTLSTGDWSGVNGDMTYALTWNGTTLTASISGAGVATQAGHGTTITDSSLLAPRPGTTTYSLTEAVDFTYDPTYGTYSPIADSTGASLRMCSTDMDPPNGGCLDLSISPALRTVMPDLYPSSGDLKVTGAGGNYVEILVQDNTYVTVSYDAGAGVVTIPNVPWTCLESNTGCP